MRLLLHPPALRRGSVVAVVAPSSPFEPTLGWVGLGWLARRYQVRYARGMFSRAGYLAGHDERRRAELEAVLADPDVDAIVAARGGYGASRILGAVDLRALAARPRWIVGFSDITALHVEAARAGVASLHASHLTALGRADARARDAFIDALEHPTEARRHEGLETLRAGSAAGPLYGGNLAMLHDCAAAGRLLVPDGCVLLLEDVTERPYRIDRMLTALDAGGHLARAAAIVLGDFDQCPPGPDGVGVEDVLRERLVPLGVPVVRGLPVGHGLRNDPVVLGGLAQVAAGPVEAEVVLGGD